MTKLQDSALNKREVDLGLRDLYMKREIAKQELILELEYVTPLFKVSPKEANNMALKVSNSIKEVESHLEDFKLAHREYVKRIIEDTCREEEEMSLAIGKCNEYLKEVAGRVHDVLTL